MPEQDKAPPKVFLSYSHDSPGHKQWVAELAARLRHKGIDAILDQWDLSPGEDVTQFMEESLRSAERVLVICTHEYVRKANAGQGGVGYERMIVTAELIRDLGTKKFIPVVRDSHTSEKLPAFMGTRLYIDLSDEAIIDEQFEQLVRELHNVPIVDRPSVGPNPYANVSAASASIPNPRARQSSSPMELPSELTDPHTVYETAVGLARASDMMGWRQFVKRIRAPLPGRLVAWRQQYDQSPPNDQESLLVAVNEAIEAVTPLLVLALTGIESRMPQFRDQRALFDDLYNISGWNYSGRVNLIALPDALGFVYHSLHGAMCVNTDQLDQAFALTDMEIKDRRYGQSERISARTELMGCPEPLGKHCTESWAFLTSGAERWPWLVEIFGTEEDFRVSLSAYYMLHSLDELAMYLAAGHGSSLKQNPSSVHLEVPLCFASDDSAIKERAFALLLRNLAQLQERWLTKGVGPDQIATYWPDWIKISHEWVQSVFGYGGRRNLPYTQLFTQEKRSSARPL